MMGWHVWYNVYRLGFIAERIGKAIQRRGTAMVIAGGKRAHRYPQWWADETEEAP